MNEKNGKHRDVVIVGGGIIGLFSAYYLVMAGKTVTVLEKDNIGDGASHGNCGLLVFGDILPMCTPGTVRSELIRLIKRTSPLSIKFGINIPLWKFLYRFWKACNEKQLAQVPWVYVITCLICHRDYLRIISVNRIPVNGSSRAFVSSVRKRMDLKTMVKPVNY